jgi:hypothetical protein
MRVAQPRSRALNDGHDASQYRKHTQGYGGQAGGGWHKSRASFATSGIGVSSDNWSDTLSAVLGNEGGTATHDRIAKFR